MHRTNAESIALSKVQFNTANIEFRNRIRDANLMCKIHSAYNSFDWSVKSHNCIGCNLDQSTKYISLILDVASENKQAFEPEELVAMYVIPLNSLYERIEDILNIIEFARKYRETKFQEFKNARRWANFFKHPKAFGWLVHHPHYAIESSNDHRALMADASEYIFVENEFLGKYYSSSATENAKSLQGHFKNKGDRVVVVLPDVAKLTTSVCESLEYFVKVLIDNPIYKDLLSDESTIVDYYDKHPMFA